MTTANAANKTLSLSIEKRIARPQAEVFRAVAEGRLFYNCSVSQEHSEIDFRVGGKYRIAWPQYGFENAGEFKEIVPTSRIAFTWIQEPTESTTPDTLVEIDLVAEGANATLVKLRHSGFRDQEGVDEHEHGWSGGLTDLAQEMVDGRLVMIRPYAVSPARLFEELSSVRFLGLTGNKDQARVDFKVGGRFEVPNDHGGASGKFVEIVPGQKIVFTWENGCDREKLADSRVTLLIEGDDDDSNKSWLTLTHEGLMSEKQQKAHREGWDWILGQVLK